MALQPAVTASVSRRRKIKDWAFWGAGGVAFVLIVAPAISIIVSVVHQALPALGWSLFTQRTNGVGIQNAILGSLLLLAGVAIIGGSIGISAGVYLAEFATGRSEKVLRFFSEVLAGMPSIVIGYIAYVTLVVSFKWGYSPLSSPYRSLSPRTSSRRLKWRFGSSPPRFGREPLGWVCPGHQLWDGCSSRPPFPPS